MMRVGVLGINHKLADLTLREVLAKACHRRFNPETSLHNMHNIVLLSTCNRTEIYFSSNELAATHSYLLGIIRHEVVDVSLDFDQKFYSYFGYDCFLHLCRVTAGLDSAIVAETEIQGQVKGAYERALEFCHLPHELHYIFQKSLRISKKVRGILPVKPGLPNIEQAILQTGQHLFDDPRQVNILLIGASEINQRVLNFLKIKNMSRVSLCNRSEEKGRSMAGIYDVPFISFNEINRWYNYDWIIFGTKASEHLICPKRIPSHPISHKLVIDLSVPRNVDPRLSQHPNITLLNIDQINRRLNIQRKKMLHSLQAAEEQVLQSSKHHFSLFKEKVRGGLKLLAS